MTQILVRNLDDGVKAALQRRAVAHGRSLEAEVRDILRAAAPADAVPSGGLGSAIAALFAGAGLDGDIPELRGHPVRPADFGA